MTLPHGSGKVLLKLLYNHEVVAFVTLVAAGYLEIVDSQVVRVAFFAEGELADEARAAGADIVGGAELVDEVASTEPNLLLYIFNLKL